MNAPSAHTELKAARIRRQGRIKQIPARVYLVTGDNANYFAVIPDSPEYEPRCDCIAGTTCSHLLAAAAEVLDENARAAA